MGQIQKLISKNNPSIDFVLFDMDRTLVDTKLYFQEEMTNAILNIVTSITSGLSLKEELRITQEIIEIGNEMYRKENCPMLIDTFSLEAISIYCKDNGIEIDKNIVLKKLRSLYKDFYFTSPTLFPYTTKVLNKISKLNIKIGIYSHAQQEWTRIKVEEIKRIYRKKYKKDISINFFTTDINDSKDKLGWESAGKYFNLDKKRTLVVGDSLTSDIYPAVSAGYKYLVYLSHTNKEVKIENFDNSKIFVIKNLGRLFT